MSISRAQAMRATCFTSTHIMSRGKKPHLIGVRANGRCKTWKTRPDDFSLPIKYGLRECAYITPRNASEWTCALKDIPPFKAEWRTDNTIGLAETLLAMAEDVSWRENFLAGKKVYDLLDSERAKWRELWDAHNAKCREQLGILADAMEELGVDEYRMNELRNMQTINKDQAVLRELLDT